jgi:alpha-amylase
MSIKLSYLYRAIALIVSFNLLLSSSVKADVILHAFNWHYNEVKQRAAEINNAGYKKVLVVPPLKSAKSGCAWWQRYQPQDIRVIDHCKGNKQSFAAMIATLRQYNIDVYADIVLNHMANERNNSQNFPGSSALNNYQSNAGYWNNQKLFGNLSYGIFSSYDFHQPPKCISDYTNVGDVQWNRLCGGGGDKGLPDIDPNNWVIQQQRNYLQSLKNMGVKGFRVDAAKHMTKWHINQIFTSSIKNNMHVFGEVITNGGAGEVEYDRFLKPYLDATGHSAYDFPLFQTIRHAFGYSGGLSSLVNPQAYGQALSPNKAVTFTVTHDIPNNDGFRYNIMNSTDELLANAYILGKDGGTPMIYSDHGESGSRDSNRWYDYFKKSSIKKMIGFHNAMNGKFMEVLASNNCAILFRRAEDGIVGINKCGNTQYFNVSTHSRFKWYRHYRDVNSGNNEIYITSGSYTFALPARNWKMWQVN